MTTRVLTGINTTGTLHIGNYVGAIRPAIAASRNADTESFFFMADLHALIKCQDPDRIERSRLQIAATWLAAGLDPDRVVFYRQSDIPEIPLLNWILTCCTSKGQMNRAHAYKAALDANVENKEDPDAGISMGLYCYPILMAADILIFNAHKVPVGKDQIQHLEMARDVATRFNFLYAPADKPFFVMPEAVVDTTHEVLPGLDGRKMSKSLGNTVKLDDATKTYGAEILRLWMASTDYTGEISFGKTIVKHVTDSYRRIRNTLRFLLANTSDFDIAKDAVAFEDMIELDRWAIARVAQLQKEVIALLVCKLSKIKF